MIEATSIAAAAASLVGACGRLSKYIYQFLKKVEYEDTAIRVLQIEIDSLAGVLGSISMRFSDSSMTSSALQSFTGYEEEYWGNVKRSMSDCEVTLRALEQILRSIKQGALPITRRTAIQTKLEQKWSEITLLKQQITAYHKTMELSLQLITVSVQLRDENLMKSLSIRLDGLGSDIAHLSEMFQQPNVIVHGGNTHAMANLEVCVTSAKRFVQTATSIVNARLAISEGRRSDHGDLTDQKRNEISSWIPKPTSPSHDGTDQTTQIGSGGSVITSVITATNFDREHANLQTLLKFSREAYKGRQFEEAKLLLQRFRKRSEARYGGNFDERNEVLSMLAMIHCRLGEYDFAEEIIQNSKFEGRDKVIKSLVFSYCEDGRWDDAERILRELADLEGTREMDSEYMLGELYLVRGHYDKAIQSCDKIIQFLGEEHVLFYMSLSLLAQIYDAKGDTIEARLHRDLVPPGIEACHIIDRLSRLWPDQAATEAQSTWIALFSHIDDPVPWDEVKKNISHGNIAGSGYGYTLLHAFVKQGNDLAIRLLIHKGADINAKTKTHGYTPLHLAIEAHSPAVASLLLENGADPFAQDKKGMSAWALAIYHGDEEIVELLLSRGINVNDSIKGAAGSAVKPLMLAIEYGRENIIELLLKAGAQFEAMDGNGNTALIRAATDSNRVPIVKRLLQLGASVNASNNHGVTALMVAVKGGSEEMVRAILEKRPNLEARSSDGETALLIASREGYRSIVILLIEKGAEVMNGYPKGQTPQDVAASLAVVEPLQQARMKQKKWFQRLNPDKMDERYTSARLAELYRIHEEREIKERREFTYIQGDEDLLEEERRDTEEMLRRMAAHSIKAPSGPSARKY